MPSVTTIEKLWEKNKKFITYKSWKLCSVLGATQHTVGPVGDNLAGKVTQLYLNRAFQSNKWNLVSSIYNVNPTIHNNFNTFIHNTFIM